MSDELVEILLARAPGQTRFDHRIAKRVEGQRVTIEREGPEVATIVRAWCVEGGKALRAEVEFDHTAIGEAAKGIVSEQAGPNVVGQTSLDLGA